MPLPPLLLAKLAKRGLLKKVIPDKEHEEVFAENYDEPTQVAPRKTLNDLQVTPNTNSVAPPQQTEEVWSDNDESNGNQIIHKISACPNIVNRYHICSDFCSKKWGYKKFRPDPNMIEKKEKLLIKFPIPEGWMEIGDPNTGRYYYWNMQTDEVSWLPPSHPKANVSLSAERLQELNNPRASKRQMKVPKNSQGESDHDSDQSEDEAQKKKPMGKKKKRNAEELDPMDPAAYSDVPRGTWATGLDLRGTAKTGVDVTASGPLFQQRPYPSPGAVLRLNNPPKEDDD